MSIRKITLEEELEIINFYLVPNTLSRTCEVFHRHKEFILKVLNKHNICARDKTIDKEIADINRKQTNLKKYGVENVFAATDIKEKIKQTNLQKYGVEIPSCLAETIAKVKQTKLKKYNNANYNNKEKTKKTCLEKFGCEYVFQCNEVKEKIKATNLEKYGVEYVCKAKKVQEKIKQTNLERYGCEYPSQSDTIKEKVKNTNLEKYGVEFVSQADWFKEEVQDTWQEKSLDELLLIKERTKQTCNERYGVNSYTQTIECREKTKKTNLAKYGVEHNSQTLNFHKKLKKLYYFNDNTFDSFPELAFYLYCKDNNIAIKRCPVKLSYIFNNEVHYYFPDFEVDNKLVEIKGDHLLKKMLIENTLENAKYQCMIENNIKILISSDYKKYLDWFFEHNYKKEDFLIKK